MIDLYINNKLCDVSDDVRINLEKDFDNKSEHVIEEAEYSFEINLPITEKNREAFGFSDVFDVGNKFTQNYDAILNVNETCILKGKFIMEDISNTEYSGNLYVPSNKSLKNVLGDKKMKDIKAHNVNISTWKRISENQWKILKGDSDADNHIIMPYILYSLPYNNADSTYDKYTQDLSASGNTFTPENIFPCYNVLSVLKDVFEGEGYKIQGNIFRMKKFEDLYQTFSYDPKKYLEEKETPYFLNFQFDYTTRKNENTSETAKIVELFNDPSMRWGTDALLLSENTTIEEIDDEYNLLAKGKDSNARVLRIPKSGWYEVDCSGMVELPVKNGEWGQEGRIRVNGRYNENDRVDFSKNMLEFQIKKTDTPLSDPKIYSFNMGVPIVPYEVDKNKCGDYAIATPVLVGASCLRLSNDEKCNMFPKNGGTALVKDYSGTYDSSDLVAAARFGCHWSAPSGSERWDDRQSREMYFTSLPNPRKAYVKWITTEDEGSERERPYMVLSTDGGSTNETRNDYGSQTAQILVRDDSYSNFEGYNKLILDNGNKTSSWDTTSNFKRRIYQGQNWSGAQTHTTTDGDVAGGGFIINTCVWLEEGDCISLEVMMPFNDYADECGWLEWGCPGGYKHYYLGGAVITHVRGTFNLKLISSNEKYIPSVQNPLNPDADFGSSKRAFININQFLGDTKVNDWIENFLKTFNLKLTKVGSKTYSIDTMLGESETYGNIIDIDEWANINDAKFKRIDTKNTTLEWSVSTDEEGYVNGNNTKTNKNARDASGYTGSITFTNPSSNSEEKIKSNYSYTWLKDITFVNGDAAFSGTTRSVPVIGDSKMWEENYSTIGEENYATDKTSRLVYLKRDADTNLIDYVNVQGYKDDTVIPEIKAPLFFVDNALTYKSNLGIYKTFRLDYSNTDFEESDESITDVFFSIKRGSQYEVDVPITLPNDIYTKIRANTLVKFNDCLFRVLGIEGHDVSMNSSATLKLITLK